jgi:hypothetical protein
MNSSYYYYCMPKVSLIFDFFILFLPSHHIIEMDNVSNEEIRMQIVWTGKTLKSRVPDT